MFTPHRSLESLPICNFNVATRKVRFGRNLIRVVSESNTKEIGKIQPRSSVLFSVWHYVLIDSGQRPSRNLNIEEC
jgi:hypothetical protein